MSPEYAYWGHVSTKSDMFSFGVIVLEMVTGRRNKQCVQRHLRLRVCAEPCKCTLLLGQCGRDMSHMCFTYMYINGSYVQVWDKWRAGSTGDVLDPSLAESQYPESEVLNCIEIGLQCVQENPADRPDASAVVLMLSSPSSTSDDRPAPSRPAFVFSSNFIAESSCRAGALSDKQLSASQNEVSISELEPR